MVSYPHDLVRFHKKSTIDIFNSAAPSGVYIFTENAESGIFGRREIQRGAGSGFLWDRHGHVVTNFHVIQGSQSIQVHLDSAGRLIDVNTAIISGSGSSAGIGFAVPVDVVNRVVPKFITNGKIPRPGIGIIVVDEEIAAGLGVLGVVIDRVVPGSEADRVGLQGIDYRNRLIGDIIVAAGDQEVRNIDEFIRVLENHPARICRLTAS